MPYVLAIANQKGGVGKTTTVVNMAAFAALADRRVLVVDNDPQGNATSVLAPEDADFGTIYTGQAPLPTRIDGLSLLPSSSDLLEQEKRLVMTDAGRLALKRALDPLADDFDLIIIDCPPALALLPLNALMAADAVLIPIQTEYYAMEGLSQMMASLEELHQERGDELALAGILLTMFDDNERFAHQVAAEIRKHLGDQVFNACIPRDIALASAPSHGQTILEHDPLSPGALAYLAATKELLDGLA